jgi:L-ascorbate metabolism protein UlaG (beta-lactamase superfamily)
MKIKQIRNATLRVDFGHVRFLIDPYLAGKESSPGFWGTLNSHLRSPRVDLKTPMAEILDVDAVIVTHTHPDHLDEAAVELIPKHLPLFAQNEKDAEIIRSAGFEDVRLLSPQSSFNGVSLIKTAGQHGTDSAYAMMGEHLGDVCGVVFQHPDEKTLYIAGDTIWNEHVKTSLAIHQPDVVILNAGDAQVPGIGSITMGCEDVRKVYQAAPQAMLIASHMEAVNHATLSRTELRTFAAKAGMADQLFVPEDDEALTF